MTKGLGLQQYDGLHVIVLIILFTAQSYADFAPIHFVLLFILYIAAASLVIEKGRSDVSLLVGLLSTMISLYWWQGLS
ncbi:hypothetical protein [Bacillus marinisedimentorum]|uniref:hypothetical protein n=1 Tax=Bacillus marinisedimentorum TaxID=1821260 RepID=UPI0008729DF2|nr:hypothetical protein [Bacillus marinisedimentorum]